ncbi:MAG: hypothetical protein M0D57_08275 [Sphingobacteriales bacterium JAD_PAG50586_3]|nr:MAG: hypothetical protein M0D57_08275 [Sphingobacteriales bacterium JAD_PAG50586_3]
MAGFLFAIKRLMAEYGIAVMLIVNTKPRNYNRPMELAHIYNHRDMSFAADSIIGIGADYKNGALRFIKVFKNKNRPVWRNEGLEGFWWIWWNMVCLRSP